MREMLLFSALSCLSSMGQSADSLTHRPRDWRRDEITLLTGYNQGRFCFAEIGFGRNIYGVVHHPFGIGYHAGAEVRVDRPALVGWKVGGYFTAGVAMGVHAIRYQEGTNGSTVLRPEIGIGAFKAKVTYAYNISLSSSRISGISTHMLCISHAFRLARHGRPH
jgi:hypothetical protein